MILFAIFLFTKRFCKIIFQNNIKKTLFGNQILKTVFQFRMVLQLCEVVNMGIVKTDICFAQDVGKLRYAVTIVMEGEGLLLKKLEGEGMREEAEEAMWGIGGEGGGVGDRGEKAVMSSEAKRQ